MNRHLSRMVAMQTIYEWSFRGDSILDEIKNRNINEYKDDVDENFVNFIVDSVVQNLEKVDEEIQKSAPEWPLEQISLIDRSILRIAIFELLYSENVPPKVAINEAVELSKQFGGENSSKFINGVLGTVYDNNEKTITARMKNNPEQDKMNIEPTKQELIEEEKKD